jgi:signal peptidase I
MTRRTVRIGLLVVAPVLLVLLLKVFLFDVYRVDSGSMEPTIRGGGELVLVRYDRAPELERFGLAVIQREGEREPFVKRVVGLPGEELRIAGGDLLVDGAKLGPAAARPRPVLVFDAYMHELSEYFELEPERSWTEWGDGLALESEVEARASWRSGLTDDVVGADGERVVGTSDVGDGRLTLRVRLRDESVFLSLSEEGDRFDAVLEAVLEPAREPDEEDEDDGEEDETEGPSERRITIVRHRRGHDPVVMAETVVPIEGRRWHRVAFSNIDDHLALDFDDRRVLAVSYGSNTPLGGVDDPRQRHLRPRVSFGGTGDVYFAGVRLHRDLHYTDRGSFGTAEPVRLGPGELFVLGDNSAESIDGREWGPITLEEVIGVPLAVPWPLAAARRLDPLEEPPPESADE